MIPTSDEKYMHLPLTDEFEKTLTDFPFVSHKSIQEEITELFDKIDFESFIDNITSDKETEYKEFHPTQSAGSCLKGCYIQ